MKKSWRIRVYQIEIVSALLMFANSCECNEELTRTQILTSTTWSMTEGACSSIDDEEYCIVKFNSNGTFTESGSFLGYTSWSLADNDETLVLGLDEYKIIRLSETELRIRWKDDFLACPVAFKPFTSFKATTIGVSALTKTSVMLYATVRTTISTTTLTFEYGTSAAYGQAISVTNSIIPGVTSNIVTASVSGLTPETVYHYRIKAINSSETFYGQDLTFRTHNIQTVSDINGNTYNTITIGSKVWMAENLKVTKFNDGQSIPLITDGTIWGELADPAYCWYDNDSVTYKNNYGALYNWFTVSTGRLCPVGWHVPNIQEWNNLTGYLGQNAGGKLKEAGTDHWIPFDKYATDESGFSALPGGWRTDYDAFSGFGDMVYWWSSSEDNPLSAWYLSILHNSATTSIMVKEYGCSVRCIKD
jgi:uncharacterized protein (TIGR02145 family)